MATSEGCRSIGRLQGFEFGESLDADAIAVLIEFDADGSALEVWAAGKIVPVPAKVSRTVSPELDRALKQVNVQLNRLLRPWPRLSPLQGMIVRVDVGDGFVP